MQAVVVSMAAGDEIRAEAGAMTYMTDGIEMDARMTGGILGGLTRKFLAGESLFLTYFTCAAATGRVAFSAPYPGKIIRFPLQSSAMICQRGSFLCATGEINITVEFTKRLGAGFFGGEGFILERFEGSGEVFAHSGGTLIPFDLKAGETLKVDTGCLVAFDPSVNYDVEFVGGIKTAVFGGEGLFFRGDDRSGARLGPDAAVLAPRGPHPGGAAWRKGRSAPRRSRRRARRHRRPDRWGQVDIGRPAFGPPTCGSRHVRQLDTRRRTPARRSVRPMARRTPSIAACHHQRAWTSALQRQPHRLGSRGSSAPDNGGALRHIGVDRPVVPERAADSLADDPVRRRMRQHVVEHDRAILAQGIARTNRVQIDRVSGL